MLESNELHTIRDFIRYAISRFQESGLYYGHGTDNARDEAYYLIWHSLHLPHSLGNEILDARLLPQEREAIYNLIQRRVKERIPLAYLTQEAWFAELSFYVDERVLIPRSPIAELIENHFQPWIAADSVKNILDLCTGSGCIAIACAKAFPEAKIDASDVSAEALAVAKKNTLRHHVENQVSLYQSDLFASLKSKKYDIIVSNPPYVSTAEMASLPSEYSHEPSLGLVAGTQGLDFAYRILQKAEQHLRPQGILIVEVGNSEEALAQQFPTLPFTWLEFDRGGGGVFLLTAQQLHEHQAAFKNLS
jgi:ribosomal protein L3 glutamine methyltransferase